ncbi:MAG: hypothetical protein LZ169_06870 [Thaumarchaeota archaeon]|nr:hypothetical protein [Candidatus Wolframiiraptor allenii]
MGGYCDKYGWLCRCLRGSRPPKGVHQGRGLCGLALAAAERYRPPSIIVRTLVHDELRILDDFAKRYRGYVGKVMDHVCGELRSLLYEVFEECEGFRGE